MKTRDAALHDELITHNFNHGTRGFACVNDTECAVCVKPGTEIAFAEPVETYLLVIQSSSRQQPELGTTAIFRQVSKHMTHAHHDMLEFADGQEVLLTSIKEGQRARILQLPAAPKTAEEADEQERAAYV